MQFNYILELNSDDTFVLNFFNVNLSILECDLLPTSRTKVMEQSLLISENSGYEIIQTYR